ncbi:hypothetical protein DIPPA_15535 [Diplonema papillatum]|nr:hypothetical protein DIPPA_15535 [Diplonema papillatum]
MAGKARGGQPRKKKRHDIGTAFADETRACCDEIVQRAAAATGGGDVDEDMRDRVVADVKKLLAAKRVEEQTGIIAGWGLAIFTRSAINDRCADESSMWHHVAALMVSFLFDHRLTHLQKAAISVFASSAKPETMVCVKELFAKQCDAWAEKQWFLLKQPHAGKTTSSEHSVALARRAFHIVCDVDCLLDHPKPVFTDCIAAAFPRLLPLMTHCVIMLMKDATASVIGDNRDAPSPEDPATADARMADTPLSPDDISPAVATSAGYGMEDLKYFSRIALYLLQRHKDELRAIVLQAKAGGAPAELATTLRDLCNLCQELLASTSLPKESLTAAGLITALLFRSIFPADTQPTHMSRWLVACFPVPTPAVSSPATGSELSQCILSPDSKPDPIAHFFSSLPTFSRVAMLKGVANCGDEEVYLNNSAAGKCLLYDVLIPAIEPLCTSSDPSLRYLSLQTFELVVRKIKDCVKQQAVCLAARLESQASDEVPRFLVRYDDKLQEVLTRILDVLWLVWDEPTAAIGHLLTDVFHLVLETHKDAAEFEESVASSSLPGVLLCDPSARAAMDHRNICKKLLAGHWQRRGKYPSLTLLLPTVGAACLRRECPSIVERILDVMHLKALAHAAGGLFAAYGKALLSEVPREVWVREVVKPTAEALLRPGTETKTSLLRHNVANYALQPLLAAYDWVATAVLADATSIAEEKVKQFRQQADAEAETALCHQLVAAHVYIIKLAKGQPTDFVRVAVTSANPAVRIHAAQLLSLGSRPSDLPSLEEIDVLKQFTVRNLKTDDSAFRSQHSELLRKWLVRCKESLHRYHKDCTDSRKREKFDQIDTTTHQRAAATEAYLLWLARFLVKSSYSTSPLERRCVAMDLLHHVASFFCDVASKSAGCTYADEAVAVYKRVAATCVPKEFVAVLMGSLSESWDKVRAATWDLLRLYPSPLPGFETVEEVSRLAQKAANEMKSCKIKDADSGALIYRLLHRKYAVHLRWDVQLAPDGELVVRQPAKPSDAGTDLGEWQRHRSALDALLLRLLHLQHLRKPGEFLPTHGVLAAVKNILADADLKSMVTVNRACGSASLQAGIVRHEWRDTLVNLLRAVEQICSDAMKNVAGATTGEVEEFAPAGVDCRGHAFFADRHDDEGDRLVVVNSWLAVKEGCGLISEIISTVPLAEEGSPCEVLPAASVASAGQTLVQMALLSKHNGAIAKACSSLGVISHRTLRCRIPTLRGLPSQWLGDLLATGGVQSKNASRILRRSAGLPHVLTAILDAEDHSAGPPILAHFTISALLSIVESDEAPSTESDPGYLQKVNALNVLKYVVEDTFLRDAVLVYASRCLVVTLEGFNHEVWAVRNSSLILYSALLQRVVGGSRTTAGSTSFRDFLTKYQSALPLLLGHLSKATASGQDRELHPCLFPLLLLFSLLAPGTDAETTHQQLMWYNSHTAAVDPSQLLGSPAMIVLSLVDKCHALKNCMARIMAARALVPLVNVPSLPDAVLFAFRNIQLESSKQPANNAAHGRLLQVEHFLVSTEAFTPGERTAVFGAAASGIRSLGWLEGDGVPMWLCPFVKALFWKVCDTVLRGAGEGASSFAADCLPHAERASCTPVDSNEIGADEMRWRSACLYIASCEATERQHDAAAFLAAQCLPATTNLFSETLFAVGARHASLLSFSDVRRMLLVTLQRMSAAIISDPALVCDIQVAENFKSLVEAVGVSTATMSPKDLVALMHSDLQASHAIAATTTRPNSLVADLWSVRACVFNQSVIEPIIHVQAGFISAELREPQATTHQSLVKLSEELYTASHPDQAVEVRLGCVIALQRLAPHTLYDEVFGALSGELRESVAGLLVNLQRVMAALLNDESDDVREAAAKLVANPPEGPASAIRQTFTSHLTRAAGIAQVDHATDMCFSWIGHLATVSRAGLLNACAHLSSVILHPVTAGCSSVFYEGDTFKSVTPPALAYAPSLLAGNMNVVFEVENHNFYAEDLMTVQLAVRELRRIKQWVDSSQDETASNEFAAFLDVFGKRLVIEAQTVAEVLASLGLSDSRVLAFSSVYRLKVGALLANTAAVQVFSLLPSHATESLWLSCLECLPTSLTSEQWADILFLLP